MGRSRTDPFPPGAGAGTEGCAPAATESPPPRPRPDAALYVQTFGGFCLYRGDRPVPAQQWRRQAAKHILVRLLLAEGRPVRKAELSGTFWPDAPERAAANALRVTLHVLRRALEPDLPPRLPSAYLVTSRYECALPTHPDLRWDVGDLTAAMAASGGDAGPEAEEGVLERALAGIHGPWLPEADALDTFASDRWRLNALATSAALRVADLALARGAAGDAQAAAQHAVAVDPGTERAYVLLLRATGAAGCPDEVRHAYAFARAQLREHADDDPAPWLDRIAEDALQEAGRRLALSASAAPSIGSAPPEVRPGPGAV